MREISVLNILRPHQNGPYRLLSILKSNLFTAAITYHAISPVSILKCFCACWGMLSRTFQIFHENFCNKDTIIASYSRKKHLTMYNNTSTFPLGIRLVVRQRGEGQVNNVGRMKGLSAKKKCKSGAMGQKPLSV